MAVDRNVLIASVPYEIEEKKLQQKEFLLQSHQNSFRVPLALRYS